MPNFKEKRKVKFYSSLLIRYFNFNPFYYIFLLNNYIFSLKNK